MSSESESRFGKSRRTRVSRSLRTDVSRGLARQTRHARREEQPKGRRCTHSTTKNGDDDACDAGDGESADDDGEDDHAWKRENGRRRVEPIANAGRRVLRRRPARGGRW